jgi:hypothetical protein
MSSKCPCNWSQISKFLGGLRCLNSQLYGLIEPTIKDYVWALYLLNMIEDSLVCQSTLISCSSVRSVMNILRRWTHSFMYSNVNNLKNLLVANLPSYGNNYYQWETEVPSPYEVRMNDLGRGEATAYDSWWDRYSYMVAPLGVEGRVRYLTWVISMGVAILFQCISNGS